MILKSSDLLPWVWVFLNSCFILHPTRGCFQVEVGRSSVEFQFRTGPRVSSRHLSASPVLASLSLEININEYSLGILAATCSCSSWQKSGCQVLVVPFCYVIEETGWELLWNKMFPNEKRNLCFSGGLQKNKGRNVVDSSRFWSILYSD